MRRVWFLTSLLNLFVPSFAQAEATIYFPSTFATYQGVKVVISDQVSDGCMPKPSAVKDAFELELLRSNISNKVPAPTLSITAVGSQSSPTSCVITLIIRLESVIFDKRNDILLFNNKVVWAINYFDVSVFAAPYDTSQIYAEGAASELVVRL